MNYLKGFLIAVIVLLLTTNCFGFAVDNLLGFSGKLKDNTGVAFHGTRQFTFRLFDSVTAGEMLFTETEAALDVNAGIWSAVIGDGNTFLSSVDLDQNVWLEIVIEGETLTPRKKLAVESSAFVAKTLSPESDLNMAGFNITEVGSLGLTEPLTDGNIASVDWSKLLGVPWWVSSNFDTNFETAGLHVPSDASIDANVWDLLNAIMPWTDANVADDITLSNYVTSAVFNAFYPIGDVNISSAVVWNAKLDLADVWDSVPYKTVGDANISDVAWGKITSVPWWSAANPDTNWATENMDFKELSDLNDIYDARYSTSTITDSNWATESMDFKELSDLNLILDVRYSPIGALTWAVINSFIPWADANVSDDISLTNITQITNRSYTDLSDLPTITIKSMIDGNIDAFTYGSADFNTIYKNTDTTIPDSSCDNNALCTITGTITGYVTDTTFNSAFPVADANISSAVAWNAKLNLADLWDYVPYKAVGDANISDVAWGKITGLPFFATEAVIDGNIDAFTYASSDFNTIYKNTDTTIPDSSCDNNTDCTITGDLDTSIDANFVNVQATNFYGSGAGLTNLSTNWTVLNSVIPWADVNISSAVVWNAKLDLPDIWNYVPYKTVGDANISDVAWGKVTGAPEIPVLNIPWADANVADDISLTNITQITNRSYTDLSDLPTIRTDTTLDTNATASNSWLTENHTFSGDLNVGNGSSAKVGISPDANRVCFGLACEMWMDFNGEALVIGSG